MSHVDEFWEKLHRNGASALCLTIHNQAIDAESDLVIYDYRRTRFPLRMCDVFAEIINTMPDAPDTTSLHSAEDWHARAKALLAERNIGIIFSMSIVVFYVRPPAPNIHPLDVLRGQSRILRDIDRLIRSSGIGTPDQERL